MTDRDKLVNVLSVLPGEVYERPTSVTHKNGGAGRRFTFNKDGELIQIQDMTYGASGSIHYKTVGEA